MGAGRSNLWVGANRGRGFLKDTWIQYALGTALDDAALRIGSYDWTIEVPQIGPNAGYGMFVRDAAQIQMHDLALFLNGLAGLVIDGTVRDINVEGTAFDTNGTNGVISTGYTGTASKGSRRFLGCNWRNNSNTAGNTASDIQFTGSDLTLIAPHFEGNPAATGRLPRYHLESLSGGAATVLGEQYAATGSGKTFSTAYANDVTKLNRLGPTAPRPIITGSLSSVTDANAKAVLGNIIVALEAAGIWSNGCS